MTKRAAPQPADVETVDVDAQFSGEGFTQAAAYDDTNPSTPPQYGLGAVRQDPASLAVAVRTGIVAANGIKDWGIMTTDRGGHYATWTDVQNWTEMEAATS